MNYFWQDLLATLTPVEQIIAAKSSYAYWLASISETPPTEEQTTRMALRECRRHLFKVKYDVACRTIKTTIQTRQERNIELLRAAWLRAVEYDSPEEQEQAEQIKRMIRNDIVKQKVVVRGYDKQGHAILVVRARTAVDTVDEEFVTTILYAMERAVATTEAHNLGGKEEKIMVVLDFGEFKSSLSPPLPALKTVTSILQHNYPERLYKLVIIDPPLWMRVTYAMLKPFLDPETRAKFIVACGDKQKEEIFPELVSEDQAMPFMLPTGKLVDPEDTEHFVDEVPFHCPYDDVPLNGSNVDQ